MADEFWQDKELLCAEREANPPPAISDFLFECLHVASVLDG